MDIAAHSRANYLMQAAMLVDSLISTASTPGLSSNEAIGKGNASKMKSLGQYYTSQARKLLKRSTIRMHPNVKTVICGKCERQLVVPYLSSTAPFDKVRINRDNVGYRLRRKCSDCLEVEKKKNLKRLVDSRNFGKYTNTLMDHIVKKVWPASIYGQITLIGVLLEAIIIVILESSIASIFLPQYDGISSTALKGIPVYLMIFLFSQVFQVVLCWDALYHQNTIQVIGFVIFNACCFAYSIFQYAQITNALSDSSVLSNVSYDANSINGQMITIIVITGLFEVIYVYCGFKLFLEFGWKIYKKIGADPHMKNMYRAYQIFVMILKLDFFFFLAFSVQFLVLVLKTSDPEFALTIVALPVTLIFLFFAVYGLRTENGKIMGLFIVGTLLAIAYFIFKLVRIYQPDQFSKYEYTRYFLTFFASLSLFVVLLTLANALVCLANFGKGLKQHIANNVKAVTPSPTGASTAIQMQDRKMSVE